MKFALIRRLALALFIGINLISIPAPAAGWNTILQKGWAPPTEYPISGYSERSPPYYQGVRPYETFLDRPETLRASETFAEFVGRSPQGDQFLFSHYEELRHVRPGLKYLAKHWLGDLKQLSRGDRPGGNTLRGIPAAIINGNPYWAPSLVQRAPRPIVSLTPLTLSRYQESLGRLHPWAVYGGSEVDWEEVFFEHSLPTPATPWLCGLIRKAYDSEVPASCDLRALGVRILASRTEKLPAELRPLALPDRVTRQAVASVRYLITFRPAAANSATKQAWPAALKTAYEAGQFEAIPHPSTLVFSEVPLYAEMAAKSPGREALQLPLAAEFSQFAKGLASLSFYGLKVLDVSKHQSRFSRPETDGNNGSTLIGGKEITMDGPYQAIFEAVPSIMGLYDKPTAHLIQIWGVSGPLSGEFLLNGPVATRAEAEAAARRIREDEGKSRIHYRNYYPPMQVNGYEVRWYRPLVAWTVAGDNAIETDDELLGSVRITKGSEGHWMPVVLSDRGVEVELAQIKDRGPNPETTALNVKKLQEFRRLLGEKLPEDLASALLNPVANEAEYSVWKQSLPAPVATAVSQVVAEGRTSRAFEPLTFDKTVTNQFERSYWNELVTQSEGTYIHKNNCDCAAASGDANGLDPHCEKNHLPTLAERLKNYYENELKLKVYSQLFTWKVDFSIPWWDGLKAKQENLIVVIPGENHDEAIVLADHYDTAYMGDVYEGKNYSKNTETPELVGHRHASKGADDNHSGTVALMEAAKALKGLKLKRDVWIVHITGEEFPADGLGSRAFETALVERQQLIPGKQNPKILGIYQLDMIGHSTERDKLKPGETQGPAIFQISPGRGERSAELAKIAHEVTRTWNQRRVSESWDTKHGRTQPWRRATPAQFAHPTLGKFIPFRGEIRPGWHFRSSLYNTDAQPHSDTGIPVVLFMENYDINRSGYHDTMDNMENIDLDFARGMTSIVIETVAQAATRNLGR